LDAVRLATRRDSRSRALACGLDEVLPRFTPALRPLRGFAPATVEFREVLLGWALLRRQVPPFQ